MTNKYIFFGLIVLAVILVIWYFGYYSEYLAGNHIYTAGATMRIMGTEFTSTDQGTDRVPFNMQVNSWKDVPKEQIHIPHSGKKSNLQKLRKS